MSTAEGLMQRQGSADLLALGSHCSVPDCRQIDFLPFKCDCCSRVYCLQHRTYASHTCEKAGSQETSTIVCPICAKAVKLNATDDPYAVFDRHTQTDCDPTNYAKVHQRPRCPVKGCREKLGAINTYTCKECSSQVCLKHRFPDDHQCPGKSGQFLHVLKVNCHRSSAALLATCSGLMTTTHVEVPKMISILCVLHAAGLAGAAGARVSQLTQAMRGLLNSKASAPTSGQRAHPQHGITSTGPMLRPQSVQNKQQRPQVAHSKEQQRSSKPRPASAGSQLVW